MIIYGDQNVSVPDHCNFGKYMLDHLRRAPENNVCLENGITREKLTYKEMTQFAVNLSVALSKLGVQKGDVVAIGSDTCILYVPMTLAVIFAGAAFTSYEVLVGKAVLNHKLKLVKPKYFICSSPFWQRYKELLQSFDCIKTYIAIDKIPDLKFSIKDLASTKVNVDYYEPKEVDGKTDIAMILYSSGTTGMPKGIQLTHSACIVTSVPDAFRQLTSLKTAMMGNWLMVNFYTFKTFKFFLLGRKVVFTTDLTIQTVLEILRDCQVDIIFCGQVYIRKIIKSGIPLDGYLDSLKYIYCRSFPLRAELIKMFKENLPKIQHVVQGFGLCECGEPMSELWSKYKPGSVGVVAPGIIVKVVDTKTREVLGPNQLGELCIKGLTMMKGYLDIERTDYLDNDGFYKTGDLVYYDNEKYFFIIDRLTDVIHFGGVKISPVELENILLRHPAVLDVGVIGKPIPDEGEVPMAFIVRKPGYEVSENELVELVSSEVTPYMQLKGGVIFISEIPRNYRGKTLRRKLREILNEHSQNSDKK